MKVQINQVEQIFSDGNHNAFPGMCRHAGKVYAAFRSAENHLTYDGKITLLMSEDDCCSWQQVALFESDSDLRDPCPVSYNGKLYIYCGERYATGGNSVDRFSVRSVVFISEKDHDFKKYLLNGLDTNTFLWHILEQDGIFYGSGYVHYREKGENTSIYKSVNGIDWEKYYDFEVSGNETTITPVENGKLYGVIRRSAEPQYPSIFELDITDRSCKYFEVPQAMQGMMIHKTENGFLLIGRCWDGKKRDNLRIEMLNVSTDGKIEFSGILPSGGDCSYADIIENDDKTLYIIYYSAHAHLDRASTVADFEHDLPTDIYFAKLSTE